MWCELVCHDKKLRFFNAPPLICKLWLHPHICCCLVHPHICFCLVLSIIKFFPPQPLYLEQQSLLPSLFQFQGMMGQKLSCKQIAGWSACENPLIKYIADVGGIAVTLSGHPFDTVKVRLQTQSSTNPAYCKPLQSLPYQSDSTLLSLRFGTPARLCKSSNFPVSHEIAIPAIPESWLPSVAGAIDCVKKTLQWEGVGGLYKVRLNLWLNCHPPI